MCEGGTYLRPNKHKNIPFGTEISVNAEANIGVNIVTLCAFVTSRVGDERTGEWNTMLPGLGFHNHYDFIWGDTGIGQMRVHCKHFSEGTADAPAPPIDSNHAYEMSFTFPSTQTSQFVHGLCVMDATNIEATSSFSNLEYTAVQGFGQGTRLWGNRNFVVSSNIQGSYMCEGGTYLRPNKHKNIPFGTEISVNAEGNNIVTLCAFVTSRVGDERTGEWNTMLPGLGFHNYHDFNWGDTGIGQMRVYCKHFSEGTADAPAPPIDSGCPAPNTSALFTIFMDDYGGETRWNIKDSNNVVQGSGGDYFGNSLNEVDLCLPNGVYTFQITDDYYDGICCDDGQGYYRLESNGAVVIEGGDFTDSETKPFTIGPIEFGCPAPKTHALFTIFMESHGGETDWNIKDSNNVVQGSGGVYDGNSLTEVDLCLPNGAYTFEITDEYSDGIYNVQGYYNLESNGAVVIEGSDFTDIGTVPFTISNIL